MRRSAVLMLVGLTACSGAEQGGPAHRVPTWKAPAQEVQPSGGATVLPESASPIGFDRMAKFPEPGWQIPRRIELAPDGARATYLMSEKGDEEMVLWSLALDTGERTVMLRAG